MKKNIFLSVLLTVSFCQLIKGMEDKEAEIKEKMLEYDRMRWALWVDYRVPLDMPARYYFSAEGKFVGSRCNCTENDHQVCKRKREEIDLIWEQLSKK